jgi:hypothetical protein
MKVGGLWQIRIIRGREQQTIRFIKALNEILQTINKMFIFTFSGLRGY